MNYYMGVDVSKTFLDVYFDGEYKRIEQTIAGYKLLTKWIGTRKDDVILVCEASGGYEKPLVVYLAKVGISYHVAQANKIRAFARAKGFLAKTDKLDSYVIFEYAKAMKVESQTMLSEAAEKIKELLKRRTQLLLDKKAEEQRLDKVSPKIERFIKRHIKWLMKEIKMLDSELKMIREAEQSITETHERFTSVPGVGDLVAYYLIAYLPELGSTNHKQLAALAGVAPYNRDSGSLSGKRFIWGGRKELRQMLYMAALSAKRWNPDMNIFYERLREKEKPCKVALVAVIRKLLSLLNSLEKRKACWEKVYA